MMYLKVFLCSTIFLNIVCSGHKEKSIDFDKANNDLIAAVEIENIELIKKILKLNPDVTYIDQNNKNSLEIALSKENPHILDLLLSKRTILDDNSDYHLLINALKAYKRKNLFDSKKALFRKLISIIAEYGTPLFNTSEITPTLDLLNGFFGFDSVAAHSLLDKTETIKSLINYETNCSSQNWLENSFPLPLFDEEVREIYILKSRNLIPIMLLIFFVGRLIKHDVHVITDFFAIICFLRIVHLTITRPAVFVRGQTTDSIIEAINKPDLSNMTGLMWASARGNNEIVGMLLKYGKNHDYAIDVTTVNNYNGLNALTLAIKHYKHTIRKKLVAYIHPIMTEISRSLTLANVDTSSIHDLINKFLFDVTVSELIKMI